MVGEGNTTEQMVILLILVQGYTLTAAGAAEYRSGICRLKGKPYPVGAGVGWTWGGDPWVAPGGDAAASGG